MSGYTSPTGYDSPIEKDYESEYLFPEPEKDDLEAGYSPVEPRKSIQFPSKGKDLYKKVTQYNSYIFPFTLAATFYRELFISLFISFGSHSRPE